MNEVEIYTKDNCPFCHRAKALLTLRGIPYTEIDVGQDADKLAEMLVRSQRRSVPQIFIDDRHIGGSDELHALDAAGKLDPLLEA